MTPPTCPAGHGPMEKVEGLYAMHRGEMVASPDQGLIAPSGKFFMMDGELFCVELWRCKTCKRVEMFDEE